MNHFLIKIGKSEIRNIIAFMYLLLIIGFIYALLWRPVPPENKDLINVLGGVVIGGAATILNWLFGSSKNESDASKADITKIETATETQP